MLTLKLLQHNIRCLATKLKNYVSLDESGKIDPSLLPSYVDDVIEVASLSSAPTTGEKGKIYVTLDTNKTYRWSGSTYTEISAGTAGVAWGSITGTLSSQSDLNVALGQKAVDTRNISAGTGLTGGGSLEQDRTISLSSASITSLAKADSALQTSDLTPYAKTTDLSVYAKTATIQPSLNKADSAVQPSGLAAYAKTADIQDSLTKADSALQASALTPYAKTSSLSVYAKTTDVSDLIDDATKSKAEITALTPIADPTTATAEDIATAYNNLLAALTA